MKRLISIFMSAAIAFTSLTASLPAYAEESASQTEQVQNTPKASGTGTVGTLLSEEINEELTEQQSNQGFNVFAAEVVENVVTITFEALEDCTLVTAILDDAGEALLYTESVDVLAGQTEAEVTIATDEMPQYFTLHAYLIDSDTFRPLCTVYECYTYTQEMQEFLAKTIEDFDQELVVSFDDSNTTNFGVFAEGTVILDYVEGVNTVASADEENNVYVFENADENITGLTAGTIMAYPYSDEIFLIVKVATVEVDGTTATVTGEETSLEEAFDYLRLESVSDENDITVDDSNLEEGITYNGMIEEVESEDMASDIDSVPSSDKDYEGEGKVNAKMSFELYNYKVGGDNANVEVNGDLNFGVGFEIKFYISLTKQQVEAKLSYSLEIDVSVTGEIKATIPMGYVYIAPPIPCVYVAFTPAFVVEATGTFSVKTEISSFIGFSYKNGKIKGNNSTPTTKTEFKLEGKFFFGISLEPEIGIINPHVASASLEAKAGFEVTASLTMDDSPYDATQHACKNCIDGSVNFVARVELELSLLNLDFLTFEATLADVGIKLFDFYYSFDYNKFDFTECPYKLYRIQFVVRDKDSKPIEGATITDGVKTATTDKNGRTYLYYLPGRYTITADHADAANAYTKTLNVSDSAFVTTYWLDVSGDDVDTDESGETTETEETEETPSDNQSTGDFEYSITDGKATITKYVGDDVDVRIPDSINGCPVTYVHPRAFYNSVAETVFIPSSVTKLTDDSDVFSYPFVNAKNLKYITVNKNNNTFMSKDGILYSSPWWWTSNDEAPWSLMRCPPNYEKKSIIIPADIEYIEQYAFRNCVNIEEVTILASYVALPYGAFAYCTNLTTLNTSDIQGYSSDSLLNCNISSVTFNENLTDIYLNAFDGCPITTLHFHQNITDIMPNGDLDKLQSYTVDNDNQYYSSIDGVLYNKDGTTLLSLPRAKTTSYTIPDGVKVIGEYAFRGNEFIESVTLSDGVKKIESYAFDGCNSLKNITIPLSVTEVDSYAFASCYGLTDVKIENSTVGDCMFRFCYNLKNVLISPSVTAIGSYAFPSSTSLTIYGEPGSYAETYAANNGYNFKNISEYPSEVTEVATSSKSSTLPEEFTHTTMADTASFTGLTAGETYNFYVLRDLDAEAPLGSENLLYISQHVVGEDGTLSVTYKPLADDYNAVAFVEQMSPFDLSTADVIIPEIIANGSTRYIQPVVMLNSEVLEIGADFEIGGDYPVIEAGTYTAVITGIGDYTGVINAEYALLSEDNKSIDIAAVLSYPTKTAYAYGEALDLTGGVIEVYYNNDTFEEVPMTADMISGFDSTKTGSQTLTITYGDLTAEYTITVAEKTVTKPILTAKAGDGKVDLTWTAIDGATQYNVYIYTTGYKLIATVTETSYTATGLENGTKYGFLVRAFVNGAWTAFTTADNVYATPVAVLKPVVTATAGEEQVTLKWNALEDATNYRVFSYMNGKYAVLGETTATTYTASDLTAGTKYGFLVRAFVNGAWTAFSNSDVVYATPTAAAVTKPEVTATAGDGKVDISWNAVTGATNYNVYIYTTGYKLLTTTTETSYTATGLTNGTKYGFLVRAFVNGAWTTFTTADNVYATPEAVVVTKPELTATAGNGEVELEWNEVTGATSYNVFIYTTGYKLLATVTDTSYTATSLTNGTEYGFLVRAYVNGAWTAFTTADNVYATPKAASTKPEFTATAGIGRVTLDWEPVEGATNYNVFTYLNGKYAVAGTTTNTTYTVTNLEAGTEYGFLVRAYVNNVWSPFTTADNIYATPTAALKPTLTVTADEGSAELSWTAVAGATNYRVFSYLNGKYTEITVTDETSCTADGLTSGTKYGFLVRAYVNGAWTAFSADDVTYATIL